MEYCCGNCEVLDFNDCKWGNEYYCKVQRKYIKPDHNTCSSFIKNRNTLDQEKNNYKPSGCFMTTVCCTILGLDDNCFELKCLRELRDFYMKPNKNMHYILHEYDEISPLISARIAFEKNNRAYALYIVEKYLHPCAKYVEQGKYGQATLHYMEMMNTLKAKYNITTTKKENEETPIEVLGKARIRTV